MTEDTQRIELRRYPLRLYVSSRAHWEELVREFQLMDIGRTGGTTERPVPARLMELIDQFLGRYRDRVEAIEAERSAAIAAGLTVMDLGYDAPVAARDAIARLGELMEECDEYCRSDQYLLTLETPADIAEFRRWNLGEVVAQLDGGEPTPWPGEL